MNWFRRKKKKPQYRDGTPIQYDVALWVDDGWMHPQIPDYKVPATSRFLRITQFEPEPREALGPRTWCLPATAIDLVSDGI